MYAYCFEQLATYVSMYVCTYVYCSHVVYITCVYVYISGDLSDPPTTPSDDITYIPYTARSYALSISLTTVPLEIAYIVRLITNATNETSYFLVLPVCNSNIWHYSYQLTRPH